MCPEWASICHGAQSQCSRQSEIYQSIKRRVTHRLGVAVILCSECDVEPMLLSVSLSLELSMVLNPKFCKSTKCFLYQI